MVSGLWSNKSFNLFGGGLMQEQLQQAMSVIRGIKIPEIPEEVMALDSELKSPMANAQTVAQIIERNAVIAGELLHLVNQPMFKTKLAVASIQEAVVVLGFKNLYNLVVAKGFERMFQENQLQKEIMEHSIEIATSMAFLSEYVEGVSRDEAYLIGLFHNVGCLLLAQKDQRAYRGIFEASRVEPMLAFESEAEHFQANHNFIGALVGKKWQLSIDFINAIILHHHSEFERIKNDRVRALIAMLQLSEKMISEISFYAYQGDQAHQLQQRCLSELMIDEEVLNDLRHYLLTH